MCKDENLKDEDKGCSCGGHHHKGEEGHEGCDGECSCGGHEHESLSVLLEDEDGREIECEVVEGFEFEGNEYALVENPKDGSTYLFKVVGDDEEEAELVVPDEEEFNKAIAHYENLLDSDE